MAIAIAHSFAESCVFIKTAALPKDFGSRLLCDARRRHGIDHQEPRKSFARQAAGSTIVEKSPTIATPERHIFARLLPACATRRSRLVVKLWLLNDVAN